MRVTTQRELEWSRPRALRVRGGRAASLSDASWRHLRSTLCAAFLFLAIGPTSAIASAPPAVSENIDSVVQFYQHEVMAGDDSCDAACEALVDDLKKAPSNVPGAERVGGGIFRSAIDKAVSIVKPVLKPPAWIAVGEGLLLGADIYIWRYKVWGAHPRTGIARVPAAPPNVTQWTLSDGTDASLFTTFHDRPNPLPVGYVAQSLYRLGVLWHTSDSDTACNQPTPTLPASLVGVAQEITWWWNDCSTQRYDGDNKLILAPLTAHTWSVPLSAIFGTFASDEQPPAGAPTLNVTPDTTITPEQIRARIEDVLNASGADYDAVRDWMDSVLGGGSENPRYEYRTIPSCAGASAATCTSRLHDAGFTGTISTHTLAEDDAVMEQPADRVTATSPASGSRAAIDSDVTVYANPATMPQMTAEETEIAEALKADNPETVGDENKMTIARRCVRYVTAPGSGRSASDCASLPIFVTGYDAAEPAANDQAALLRNPAWVLLNHRVEIPNSRWYRGRTEPAPGCALPTPETSECDEFPFWSTLQAYGGSLSTIVPSIRYTVDKQNGLQGNRLSHFYSNNLPGPKIRFHGCDVLPEDPVTVTPLLSSAFLNVPIGEYAEIPTTGICNKPT